MSFASEEPYRLWYEYLKRTDPATWTEEVRRDFGGVLTKSFEEWFNGALVELWTPGASGVAPVRQYDAPASIPRLGESETAMVIDLDKPKDVLVRSFEFLLDLKQKERKAGRQPFEQLPVRYPFFCRPDVAALKITLLMYDTKKANENWPNWKVGQAVQSVVEATTPILRKHKIREGDTPAEVTAKKKMLEQVTKRYLKNADALLENVAKGIFPNIKKEPRGDTRTQINTPPAAAGR